MINNYNLLSLKINSREEEGVKLCTLLIKESAL